MAKEVKNRVSLDASRFERGVRDVRRNIKSLERGLTIDLKTAAKLGGAAILGMGAAMTGISGIIALGVKSVINLGAEMEHLSIQTGVAVSDLLILRQAFEDNGVSADNARLGVNKMQKTLSDARNGSKAAQDAFSRLGLSIDTIGAMGPAAQFEAIGNAIAGIQDPADRAAAAMGVFGRSGAEMLSVFGEGKIADAAASLGSQAQMLEKNSRLFERAGTLLDRAGNKVRGFFVGIADQVVPVILPLLEAFDKLDLAEQGVQFGESLARGMRVVIGAFQNNQIGELIWLSLKEAGLNFINLIVRGWAGITSGLFNALFTGFDQLIQVIGEGLIGAAKGFGAVFLEIIASAIERIPGLREAGASVRGKAVELFDASAESLGRAAELLNGFPGMVSDAFENGMADLDGFSLFDTSDLDDQRRAIIEAALAAVPAIGEAAARLLEPRAPILPGATDDEAAIASGRAPIAGGISSLAAIGGGGGVGAIGGVESLVDQSRRQTGILSDIRAGINDLADEIGDALTGGGTTVAVLG